LLFLQRKSNPILEHSGHLGVKIPCSHVTLYFFTDLGGAEALFLLPRATPSRVIAKHADQPLAMRVTNIPGPALQLNLNLLLFS